MRVNKLKISFILIFFLCLFGINKSVAQQKFEKTVFYNTMETGDVAAINNELNIVGPSSINNKNGYEGALLMKEASLIKKPKKKLDLFKAGRIKLETALLNDKDNTEFHFLRLTIEENAPKIVKYRNDIQNDKLIVQKNFKGLPAAVQQAILNYCKKSKVLHAEEF